MIKTFMLKNKTVSKYDRINWKRILKHEHVGNWKCKYTCTHILVTIIDKYYRYILLNSTFNFTVNNNYFPTTFLQMIKFNRSLSYIETRYSF